MSAEAKMYKVSQRQKGMVSCMRKAAVRRKLTRLAEGDVTQCDGIPQT